VLQGLIRTAVYQDTQYATRYLERVRRVAVVDTDADADGAAELTRSAARHIAVWMCYQDTIQVALQKTRRNRFDRIRAEARADDAHIVQVRKFLHPQVEETTDTPACPPRRLSPAVSGIQRRGGRATRNGVVLTTTSVIGCTALALLARLRPLRPRSLRFIREQAAIDSWLDQAVTTAITDPALACQIIECQQVLKGYGATHAHGSESFAIPLDAARMLGPGAANRLAALRAAALVDEDGSTLRSELARTRFTETTH
jgi:indolepyruvate ferredoxin oxidoreductase beta subunit